MSCAQSWRTILGTMALLATLALTSPGVQLARAGDGDAPATAAGTTTSSAPAASKLKPERIALPSDGPTCGPTSGAGLDRRTDRAVVRLQQELAARAAEAAATGGSSQPDGIMLNNRGYNYGTAR